MKDKFVMKKGDLKVTSPEQKTEELFGQICEMFIETEETFVKLINGNMKNKLSYLDTQKSKNILKNINRQRNMLEDMIAVFVISGIIPKSKDETIMNFTHKRLKRFTSLNENIRQVERFIKFCDKIMNNTRNEIKQIKQMKGTKK